jgi:NAD(P)-dependent dehydrogenase (short-subunit alcohol dehydrogenase family)
MDIKNLFDVKGKVVLITGGSRGIGLMIARAFAENGARVYISSRNKSVCDQVAVELSKLGTCISIPADISNKSGRDALISQFKEYESSLDVLVNNAGAVWGASIEDHPEEAYDKVMDLNVKSMFFLTRDLLPQLSSDDLNNPARVINIGSIDGIAVPGHDNPVYSISKTAVHQLTKVMANKFGSKGITVNAIAPGLFESKMTAFVLEHARKAIEEANPLKRIGVSDDMAGVAIYLASKAGAYVNGAIIPVDGGIHLTSYKIG